MVKPCLCNGTGGIHIKKPFGIEFHPCPDSNCMFDKEQADRELEAFEFRVRQFKEQQAV